MSKKTGKKKTGDAILIYLFFQTKNLEQERVQQKDKNLSIPEKMLNTRKTGK